MPIKGKLLVAVGAALLVVCGALMVLNWYLAGLAATPNPNPNSPAVDGSAAGEDMEKDSAFFVDWDYWLSVNPAIVGWVEIPGTDISQPVVQAPRDDPRFYLQHDVYGNWNPYGCPYLDAGCEQGMDSPNIVIMGHNISTPPAMFHDLQDYHDPDYAGSHLCINVHTLDGTRSFTVVGVHTIGGWEEVKRVSFADELDFELYCAERLEQCDARYANFDNLHQMLTLCSCSYFFNPRNERTLVYAGRPATAAKAQSTARQAG